MSDHNKQATVSYEPLIAFANEKITEENWEEVLSGLGSRPAPPREARGVADEQELRDRDWQAFTKWVDTYHRLGFMAPLELEDKRIAGPEPLRRVQQELGTDLERLADPVGFARKNFVIGSDFKPSSKDAWDFAQSGETERLMETEQDVSWLVERISTMTRKGKPRRAIHADGKTPVWVQKVSEIEIPMSIYRAKSDDSRVLLTDRVSFVPVINDLRTWVYFRLANLWSDGFLSRIGRCQNGKCRRFFLGKTSRKEHLYCSRRCAQRVTAPERVKASRARCAAWESIGEDLKRALKGQNPANIKKAITKAESAFADAFRRQKGPRYEEGKRLLARAKKQLRQLR